MAILIIGSIAWTYIVQTTGSLIPSMVAHAMTNSVAV
ncbi:MAG: CPBP family intramembrane metalloprotease [Proteobacteria bacterium]|nr:CPBP family intramembrane metalloprotease [Pseudomonadota bacterium]